MERPIGLAEYITFLTSQNWPISMRLFSFFVVVLFVTGSSYAQSLTREERHNLAQTAYSEENWPVVTEQVEEILLRWPKDEEALALQAKVSIFGPDLDVSLAKRSIRKLPKSRRNSFEIRELDLWIDYRYGGSFMPGAKLAFQLRKAKKLLDESPKSVLANLIAGSIRLEDFRDLYHAVRFNVDANLDQIISAMGPDGGISSGGQYVTAGMQSVELPILRNEQKEQEAGDDAVHFLTAASRPGMLHSRAFRALSEASVRGKKYDVLAAAASSFIQDNPDRADGYLALGLSLFMQGNASEAGDQFDKAVELLPAAEREVFSGPVLIFRQDKKEPEIQFSDSLSTDYWARKDYLWSSPINERLVEHRARVVYADLIWGRPSLERRGWETEPGLVHIRYGWPRVQMQFQDQRDKYFYVDYGYRAWVFLDMAKADRFTFWSPEGGSASSSGLCDRGRNGLDYEKCSEEWFRDDPERTQRVDVNRVRMNMMASVFENDTDRTLVTPFCFPETDQFAGTHVALFDRRFGESIPKENRLVKLDTREKEWSEMPCDVAQVVVQQLDNGGHQLSLESESARGFATARLDVGPDNRESGLRLSDLLLARLIEEDDQDTSGSVHQYSTETGMSWLRYGKTIYPVAEPAFDSGTPIYLYLETYGLSAEGESPLSFQAALVLGRLDDDLNPKLGRIFGRKEEASVSVEFEQVVTGTSDSRYFILETTGVAPGSYVLAVRVVEQRSGKQSVVNREIVIK